METTNDRAVSPTESTRSARWDVLRNRLRRGGPSSMDDDDLEHYSYEFEIGSADQFYVDLRPKKITIEDVVHNEKVLEALTEFSRSEHTEENLCFLHDVIHYKKDPTVDKKQQIISHYFAKNAPTPVNVSYEVRERILRQAGVRADVADVALFDGAWDEVEHLVRQDILVRYNAQMESSSKRKILNPASHRRMVIVFQVLNIFLFAALAILTVCSTVYMRKMHEQNTHEMILLEMWRTSYIDTRTGLFTYVMSGETEDLASFYTDIVELKRIADRLTAAGVFPQGLQSIYQLVVDIQNSIVQQMKEGNDTNALMLLRSPMYEMTWTTVAKANAEASKIVLQHMQHESEVLNIFSIIAIIITCIALLYSVPSACLLIAAERRRAKQVVRITKLMNRRLQELSDQDRDARGSTYNLLGHASPSPMGRAARAPSSPSPIFVRSSASIANRSAEPAAAERAGRTDSLEPKP